jgi:hypothetical protein
MNYLKIYINLVRKCEERNKDVDGEKHHIFPVSIYGKNNRIVKMTYREHLLSHFLLWRICLGRYGKDNMRTRKMLKGALVMTGTPKNSPSPRCVSARIYSIIKENVRQEFIMGDNNPSKRLDVREKISIAKTGVSRPDMKGKRYFGADEETIRLGTKKMITKKTGMKIVYPKNRNSGGAYGPRPNISKAKKETLNRYKNMTEVDVIKWLSDKKIHTKNGIRRNPNVCNVLILQGIDVDNFYNTGELKYV